ncbi:DUF6538 domain-containing protein [Janthinobacterium sp. PAMC25594]|uniref:DUF6538 domain-containing protein n=1 Tax=Janthinobacterium sp. PAMC25594 TaxID=2861284 RepID=UPI001C6372C9|nr:DUF6538 domain-containing protein [Janthinobacterium sp. PAMC25594]QYG08991.1 hypothetical protein KY494_09755 [Janthinobacterium sp. PAMC25594]
MLPNLRKTQSGYVYLKTVPADLRAAIGKTVIKKALGRQFSVAKAMWAELESQSTKLFQTTRQQLALGQRTEGAVDAYLKKDSAKRLKALDANRPGLGEQLSALYLAGLSADYTARSRQERWMHSDEPDELTADVAAVLASIKNAVVLGDVSAFIPIVEQLTLFRGYRLVDPTGEDLQALTYEFLRAAQEGCQILAARQRGEFAQPVLPDAEPLPAAWEIGATSSVIAKGKARLSDVTPLYVRRLSTHGRKTQTTNFSWWKRLIEFCGDKVLEDVSSLDIYKFFESRLHASEAAWSMKYCMKVRAGLAEAFGEAKTQEMCPRNPVVELDNMPRITAAEEKTRKRPRYPYSTSQLNTLLSSAWYDPGAPNWRGRMKWDLGARYWIPLICLYQGFRVREPLQLLASDIIVEAGFVLVRIQVTDEAESEAQGLPKRSVKNEATRRIVPIHPILLELGFMDFVASAKKRGAMSPLFPSAIPERSSEQPIWGRAYEQRFVPFVRDVLGFGAGYGNHSFRHTLEDCLRNAQFDMSWPAGLGQFYSGRTLPSDADRNFFLKLGSERKYGKGYDPTLMMPFVKNLQYKGLSLPKPFSSWLDGRPAVDSHLISVLDGEWGGDWRGTGRAVPNHEAIQS